ncbi:unnamed protein product, partial [Ectocarpus sp. 12 AP-2014]
MKCESMVSSNPGMSSIPAGKLTPDTGGATGRPGAVAAAVVVATGESLLADSCLGLLRLLAGRRGVTALAVPLAAAVVAFFPASTTRPPTPVMPSLLFFFLPPTPPSPPPQRRRARTEPLAFVDTFSVSAAAAAAFFASRAAAEMMAASSDCLSESAARAGGCTAALVPSPSPLPS